LDGAIYEIRENFCLKSTSSQFLFIFPSWTNAIILQPGLTKILIKTGMPQGYCLAWLHLNSLLLGAFLDAKVNSSFISQFLFASIFLSR
jgi:hypothetical protein